MWCTTRLLGTTTALDPEVSPPQRHFTPSSKAAMSNASAASGQTATVPDTPVFDVDRLYMSQIPQDFSRSLVIAEYWTRDLGLETAQIVRALATDALFRAAEEGWLYHAQSELAIPPEAGSSVPAFGQTRAARVCPLACALTRVPIYTVIAASGSSSLCKGMAMLAEEMLCPSPPLPRP